MPPRPQPGMQPTACGTTTAVYRKPARWHSAPQPHKTMSHLPRVAPSKIQCTNPNASQAAARHATHGHHNCRVTSPLTALPASQNNETPTTCSAVQHAPNNKSSADRHVRWLETSTKCSKYILCINYASQAKARQITVDTVSKLTAKRQRLPDRGRSPRAPPRVHFRPPPSRPAKDDRNQVPYAKKGKYLALRP